MARITGRFVALLFLGFTPCSVIASNQNSVAGEFVGSTLSGELVREFLGGLATDKPCHYIRWQLTLSSNQTYTLAARYHVPTRGNPNRSEEGPKVESGGKWQIVKGAKSRPEAVVYRLTNDKDHRSISFVKIGEDLLHLLNANGSLMAGNGGWSYTLNRADRAEKPGDHLADNAPDMSYKISPLATGPAVFGVFEGRSPCHGIASDLNIHRPAGCFKVKWRVTLYQNPETRTPTTYKIEGSLHRQAAREGNWSIIRGVKADPKAVVYQLSPMQNEAALFLLKADDDVLFFLNQNREPLIGHADFSYTLNRRTE